MTVASPTGPCSSEVGYAVAPPPSSFEIGPEIIIQNKNSNDDNGSYCFI
jgi:hypothetical protein